MSYSEFEIPLLSFDGGFSHIFGINSANIYQVFCSSNSKKWRSKSNFSKVYACLEEGSPNYKPYKFKVPSQCKIADKAWKENKPKDVFFDFNKWLKSKKENI